MSQIMIEETLNTITTKHIINNYEFRLRWVEPRTEDKKDCNRFVDRVEGAEIAVKAGQVYRNFLHNTKIGLFSEDLY